MQLAEELLQCYGVGEVNSDRSGINYSNEVIEDVIA